MDDDDEIQGLKRWVRIMNKGHGYAGVFNYENSDDKRIVECSTFEEWCEAIRNEYGIEILDLKANANDPPDFYAKIAGREQGVELVQLIEQDHKQRASKNESPHAGRLFLDMQWSQQRFETKLNEIISKKAEKYQKSGVELVWRLTFCLFILRSLGLLRARRKSGFKIFQLKLIPTLRRSLFFSNMNREEVSIIGRYLWSMATLLVSLAYFDLARKVRSIS
ncbi:hypothetical protein [Celeribacter sp. PS-C1]|uniref:hypothetical protein n=1 Tax=Celeribacter sp. PS-C1 TaxID=2820813 RepID=UPI001CA5D4A5|nr:hypothetical protein [Celeribacter sp. PS-C1]MBW6419472.1 hypothetical protein [Celeribacter sp. PS-C1]